MKRILALTLACATFAVSTLTFSSCGKSIMKDDAFSHIFSEVFDKKANAVTEADLAKVESFEILTYSDINNVTVTLEGYSKIMDSENPDKEAAQEFVKSVDISDFSFESFDDFKLLTGLKEFHAIYTGFKSFDFLSECKLLEEFTVMANYDCTDYSVIRNFPNIKTFAISEGSIDDLTPISEAVTLTSLTLDSVQNGEYGLSDLSFVSSLTNLESFSAASGMIYEIDALSSLENLEYLNLSYNGVDDVTPIAGLKNLKYIDLTQNLVRDLSSLKNYDPESFEVIILDLNSSIKDWSPLDYLGKKVQGRPTGYKIDDSVTAKPIEDHKEHNEELPKVEISVDTGEEIFEEGFGDNDIDVSMFDF